MDEQILYRSKILNEKNEIKSDNFFDSNFKKKCFKQTI